MAWPQTSTTTTPGSTLNFRSGPGMTQSIIGSIPNGSTITITGDVQNGWYPVTWNGQTGWVSATYVQAPATSPSPTPDPAPAPAPSPTPAPAPIPHTQEGSNPFYSPGSTYGSSQNWYTTPLVSQSQNFDAEYEKFVTDSGFGGINRTGTTARSLIDRAKSGMTAAQMNNPALTPRAYLNDILGPNFLRNAINAMTPQQRGEQHGLYAPRSRWNPR